MIIPSQRFLRRLRHKRRPILALLLFFFAIDALVLLHHRPRTIRSPVPLKARHGPMNGNPSSPEHTNNTSVFIVSVHRNTGQILPTWGAAVLAVIDHLGAENVYFSALESGSQDDTKERLAALKDQLDARHVPNTVTLGMTVWEQLHELWDRPDPDGPRQEGWIWNQEDQEYDLRRIAYLARERNRAMEPLRELQEQGMTYQKVLWLNDVVFDLEDFVTLLHTRQGNYAAACSLDFKQPPHYYDTFALRDDQGQKTASNFWPWFLSPVSRQSAWQSQPVPVQSCWNGMVLFDAAPFYADPPLRFRATPDSLADLHLEASECCLIHADNVVGPQAAKGVWLNPNVRVGYSPSAYRAVQGRQGEKFPGPFTTVVGAWTNRWLRCRGRVSEYFESATVRKRLERWWAETPGDEPNSKEPGVTCLINEKQIMWLNGWRHI